MCQVTHSPSLPWCLFQNTCGLWRCWILNEKDYDENHYGLVKWEGTSWFGAHPFYCSWPVYDHMILQTTADLESFPSSHCYKDDLCQTRAPDRSKHTHPHPAKKTIGDMKQSYLYYAPRKSDDKSRPTIYCSKTIVGVDKCQYLAQKVAETHNEVIT